jgi:hypothetical protein
MNFLLHLFSQPTLYSICVALVLAFYIVWVLARQQYLGTFQQFNLLTISLVAMTVAAVLCQVLFPGYLNLPTSQTEVVTALRQPFTILSLLCAYMAAILASWYYLRRIHYPFWRMMDSNVIGISLVALGWLVGTLIRQPGIALGVATIILALIFLAQLALYQKIERTGVVCAANTVATFGVCLAVQYVLVPWQVPSSVVEYVAGGVGIAAGLVALIIRLRWKVPHTTLTQLPTGVSQKFRETFSTLISKRPSSSDGLSHKKNHQ